MKAEERKDLNRRIKAMQSSRDYLIDRMAEEQARWDQLKRGSRTTWRAMNIKRRLEAYDHAVIHFGIVLDNLNTL